VARETAGSNRKEGGMGKVVSESESESVRASQPFLVRAKGREGRGLCGANLTQTIGPV
jgi:hypothetical protein